MTDNFLARIAEATRLVRAGDPAAATALIQRALRGRGAPEAEQGQAAQGRADRTERRSPGPLIEGVAVRLDPAPEGDAASAPRRTLGRRGRPRAGLGQTLRDLAKRLPADAFARHRPNSAPAPLPEGSTFEARMHQAPDMALAYRLYTPAARAADQRLPLVVMLHGCTQTPEDFAAGTRMNSLAEAEGFLVAYPAQSPAANPNRCWNWFLPEHQARGRGEAGAIAGMVRDILRDHPVDPQRVFVAGLSAGGAAAAALGAAYPDLFAAVGVHSGLPSGAARDVVSAFAAMRRAPRAARVTRAVPTIVFHGDSDPTVHQSNGDELVAQITAGAGDLIMTAARGRSAGGRAWTRVAYTDAAGRTLCEDWRLHGGGHAWSGGDASGSHVDPDGPDASTEMLRFFLAAAGPT